MRTRNIKTKLSDKELINHFVSYLDLPEHQNIDPCRFFRTVGDEIVIFADGLSLTSPPVYMRTPILFKIYLKLIKDHDPTC